jgi:hypothetical protein
MNILFCTRWFVFAFIVVGSGSVALAAPPSSGPASGEDQLSRLYQSVGHYIVDDRKIQNELGAVPLPFVDWGFIQPGFIAYTNRQTGAVLPLSGKHDLTDPADVLPVPVAVPEGVRIRTEPATRGGSFEQVVFAPKFGWEKDCTVHTLIYDDADGKYKLWYHTGPFLAYAESRDFKTWDRPLKNYVAYENEKQTNILGLIGGDQAPLGDLRSLEEVKPSGWNAIFVDPSAPPEERYKCTFLAHVTDKETAE